MPKIKIKDWNGIVTNIDQVDVKPDTIKDSTNFRFKKGYASYESRLLTELGPPNLGLDWSQGFTWETGIYCTLTNDPLNNIDDELAWNKEVLVLIAKALDSGTYHRLIYLYDIEDETWVELSLKSAYGIANDISIENHDGNFSFDGSASPELQGSFFSTTVDGKAFFQVEKGTLKLYLPHDCFKIQYIKRNPIYDKLNHNAWYIDRLVEPYDKDHRLVKVYYDGFGYLDQGHVPPEGTLVDNVSCATGRRLGIKFAVETIDDQDANLEEIETTYTHSGSSPWFREIDMDADYQRAWYLFTFLFYDAETGDSISPNDGTGGWWDTYTQLHLIPPYNGNPMDPNFWWCYESETTGFMVIERTWAEVLEDSDGNTLADIAVFGSHEIRISNVEDYYIHNSYRIHYTDFTNRTWIYKGKASKISESGFVTATDKKYSIIATAILDEREEIIMETYNGEANVTAGKAKFALRIWNIYVPININKRITRVRFYHKVRNLDVDYVLHKEIDYLDTTDNPDVYNETFDMAEFTNTGLTLSQNIGYLVDWEHPERYDVLRGFKSFTTESDISVGITSGDTVNLFHSTVGGGSLMADLVYDASKLPITGISNIKALANINGKIGAFTDERLYVIASGESLGQLIFTVNDTLDLGVKNFNDIASIQGGAIANTRTGIFYTDGYTTQLLSEPINDIVSDNYDTSSIYYNAYKREIYFKPTSSEDLWRFRFEDKVWEKINATIDGGEAAQAGEPEVEE